MDNQQKEQIKREGKLLLLGFIALAVIVFIAFHKSGLVWALKISLSLFWIFVVPGYALALCSKLRLVERLIIGVSVQTAVFGLAGYYFGLIGWHISTHGLVLPVFSIIAGLILWWKVK